MTTIARDRIRLAAAERLLRRTAERNGLGSPEINAIFPRGQCWPVAIYLDRGDMYLPTLVYDVAEDAIIHMAAGTWIEDFEAATGLEVA